MNVIGWGLCREVWEEGRAKGWVRGFKEPSQSGACLIRREDTPRRGAAVCKGSVRKEYLGLHLKTPSWWGGRHFSSHEGAPGEVMVMLPLSSVLLPRSLLFLSVPHGRGCSSVVKGRGRAGRAGSALEGSVGLGTLAHCSPGISMSNSLRATSCFTLAPLPRAFP